MIIVVDANVVVSDPYLRNPVWAQLGEAVKTGKVRVFLPQIVVAEAVSKRRALLKGIGKKLSEAAKGAPSEARGFVDNAKAECAKSGESYEDDLNKSWADLGFSIAKTPQISHDDIASRAIRRIPPFNDQGGGYRDTLHWYSLLTLAEENKLDKFCLVSGDKAFGANDRLKDVLRREFEEISEASILFRGDIGDVDIPGHFISDAEPALEYEKSLLERLGEILDVAALNDLSIGGIAAPEADYTTLTGLSDYKVVLLTARRVQNQVEPELRFRVTASLSVEDSYWLGDANDFGIAINNRTIKVVIRGTAATLTSSRVGKIVTVNVERAGIEPGWLAKKLSEALSELDPEAKEQARKLVERLGDTPIADLSPQEEGEHNSDQSD